MAITTNLEMSNDELIQEQYFLWLCGLVGISIHRLDRNNRDLAWLLHHINFYDLVPNDGNRAKDGKKLRERYFDETGIRDCECLEGECSVFEMLVALSERMDYILWESRLGRRTDKWFWEMIQNMGLELFDGSDGREERERKHYKDQEKVDRMLSRHYFWTGRGGLFPLKMGNVDQRNVEIWYQMMSYIEENYNI